MKALRQADAFGVHGLVEKKDASEKKPSTYIPADETEQEKMEMLENEHVVSGLHDDSNLAWHVETYLDNMDRML